MKPYDLQKSKLEAIKKDMLTIKGGFEDGMFKADEDMDIDIILSSVKGMANINKLIGKIEELDSFNFDVQNMHNQVESTNEFLQYIIKQYEIKDKKRLEKDKKVYKKLINARKSEELAIYHMIYYGIAPNGVINLLNIDSRRMKYILKKWNKLGFYDYADDYFIENGWISGEYKGFGL